MSTKSRRFNMKLRHIVSLAILASGVLLFVSQEASSKNPQMNIPEEYKIGGLAVGLQAYTFNRYTVMEAIEKTAAAGGRVIEFYSSQRLSPDPPDVVFNHHSPDEVIDEVLAKLREYNILPVNYGVVRLTDDEQEQRQIFEFVKRMGMQAISSEPSPDVLDLIERMVREYDIMVAIHNHPKRADRPDYMHWDPAWVKAQVEHRDPRIGASADIGHWIRSGISPVEGLRTLEGRLVSVHFSDVDQFGIEGRDVVAGLGVANVPAVLEELKRQNFGGHISIEYESNWYDNVTDVAQIIGFIRGWSQTR